MTSLDHRAPTLSWTEPPGVAVRGTLIVIPGRGESPSLYERLGARLAGDAYRTHVVGDPTEDAQATAGAIAELLAAAPPELPRVLVGSDTGALFAVHAVTTGRVGGVTALVLAGLPASAGAPASPQPTPAGTDWDSELSARTACSAHQRRLAGDGLRRGAIFEPVPSEWAEADLSRFAGPILGLHGEDDELAPLAAAQAQYARAAAAQLVSIAGGRHDALNDQTHRSVAATVVLFLERLRLGTALPPIVRTAAAPGWDTPPLVGGERR